MDRKLSSLVCRLSSAALLLALPACRGPSTHSEPLITAEKLPLPLSTPKPQPKREMVTYHLTYVSAMARVHALRGSRVISSFFPPVQAVRLGYFGPDGDFQSSPQCTGLQLKSSTGAVGDVAGLECDIALPLGDPAVFGALGEFHRLTPKEDATCFISLNRDEDPKSISATLSVSVNDKPTSLLPIPHLSSSAAPGLGSKASSDMQDQWVASTPCPKSLPRKEKGLCAPLR